MPGGDNDGEEQEARSRVHSEPHGDQNGHAQPPLYADVEDPIDRPKYYSGSKEHPLKAVQFDQPEPPEAPENQTCAKTWHDYPKQVGFIVGNEFCERFSYYGMRAVLRLYLGTVLKYDTVTATSIYTAFSMLCYFSPILGSILADGYIGRFHTIMWISLFYASGNILLAVAAALTDVVHPWLDLIGLAIIGLGTGGIKPCVQPFGADQFKTGQERSLEQFFSIFYFAINAGSTVSMIITPILRVTPCQNRKTCYPLAFGIPAILMVIAVVFFALGSFWYKKSPPKGNVITKVARTMGIAVKNKRTFDIKRDHWLDHSLDSHHCENDDECREAGSCQKATFVEDLKAVFKVLIVFFPLPIFWALYEQQGSTWVTQATQMEFEISPGVHFLPDQMGVLNTVMIMVLIPIFSVGIYPLFNKFVKVTPLRKMCAGSFLAGVAYIVCMIIQINIKSSLPALPENGKTLLHISNYVQSCPELRFLAKDGDSYVINDTFAKDETRQYTVSSQKLVFEVQAGNQNCTWLQDNQEKLKSQNVVIPLNKVGYTMLTDTVTDWKVHTAATQKSESGEVVFSMNVNYYVSNATGSVSTPINVGLCRDTTSSNDCHPEDEDKYVEFEINSEMSSKYSDVKTGKWGIFLRTENGMNFTGLTVEHNKIGGILTLTILEDEHKNVTSRILQTAQDNTYSILWQIPQYFVLSVAEILFSITANEFAYSQAPLSMKSTLFACYLLTNAIGNVIILIITPAANFGADMTWPFLIYAILMFLITGVFILISIRYKYKSYAQDDDGKDK